MTNQVVRKSPTAPIQSVTVRPEPAQASQTTSQGGSVQGPHVRFRRSWHDRDESDPERCTVELVQRGRLILDVSAADLEAAETTFGGAHPTTWHFRTSMNEAQRSWDRLKAELGSKIVQSALEQPPLTALALDESENGIANVMVILIGGQTYRPQRVAGSELAPVQWAADPSAPAAGTWSLLSLPARRRVDSVRLRQLDLSDRRDQQGTHFEVQAFGSLGFPRLDLTDRTGV